MLKKLYEFKRELEDRHTFFCFSGPISQELVVEIGNTLEQKMNLEKASRTTILRVFSMVVEEAQNIIRYSDEKCPPDGAEGDAEELSFGVVAIGYEDGHYFVSCGNLVERRKVGKLREKLNRLKEMNKDEIKEYYKKQRRKGPDAGSKGAGLGLIEMARKASRPIEFDFRDADEQFSFFAVKTII
ncbi:hypothetical protein DENIS_1988 [Desulfonema ishimotonii]|uniref:Histidine kinase n=1 Tax=Desulfonema ishimotonii TaxID=45657 RepID=A0A401FVP2_9BACT|nr:SiaB family protein kinase [Desulfonema ishimotonii]GBC61028.1 hypothetical protein DENIS_1988 [Desulfonema ishimotonii]